MSDATAPELAPERLRRRLDAAGLGYLSSLNPSLERQLSVWLNALLEQPRNLTAVRTPPALVAKHVLEPLLGRHRLLHADLPVPSGPLLDVGSGNGAPGLPFALCEPHRPAALLDARQSAAQFLGAVLAQLDGHRIEVRQQRAEQAARTALRERFALALTRAAAPPPVALELTIPFLQVGGLGMLWTGELDPPALEQLRAAAQLLGAELTPLDPPHDIIVATKLRPTVERYPRTWNQIRRRPLAAIA